MTAIDTRPLRTHADMPRDLYVWTTKAVSQIKNQPLNISQRLDKSAHFSSTLVTSMADCLHTVKQINRFIMEYERLQRLSLSIKHDVVG